MRKPTKATKATKAPAPPDTEESEANVDPSGSGQFLNEYRKLLDNCYTVPIPWGEAGGQNLLQEWEGKFIDRIGKWTTANLPDRSYGFILERIIKDISAYEFVDVPVYHEDGTFDEKHSKVRFDYTYKVRNDAPGAVLNEITVTTDGALCHSPFEIGELANARDAALRPIRENVFAAIQDLIGKLPEQDNTPKPFERTATAQYDKMLMEELPGFSICPFPMRLSIGTRRTYPTVYPGIEGNEAWVREPERWDDIGRALRNSGRDIPDDPLRDLLDTWSYANITPEGSPDPKDIPNPRMYLLDGAMIPDERMGRNGKRLSEAAETIFRQFARMVRGACESPMNLREQALKDLLDRHFENGGNPDAFVKFVDEWGPGYQVSGEKCTPTFREPIQRALAAWVVTARQRMKASTTSTAKPKPAEARPEIPSLAEKFAKVPGSLDKWMGLLRSVGVVDTNGQFAMAKESKGKGKLIAAWTSAQELFQLDGYATDKELVWALKGHIPGLTGLGRLDKVRTSKGFSDLVTEYKEDLQDD